jgi:hypothetical protein
MPLRIAVVAATLVLFAGLLFGLFISPWRRDEKTAQGLSKTESSDYSGAAEKKLQAEFAR